MSILTETLGGAAPGAAVRKRRVPRTGVKASPNKTQKPQAKMNAPSTQSIGATPTHFSQTDQKSVAAQQGSPTPWQAPKFDATSYDSDPVLMRIRALGTQSVTDAQTEADKIRNQSIIDFGAADTGRQLGVGQNVQDAAAQNPFSVLAKLHDQAKVATQNLDESANKGNLFYSGRRAQDLTDLGKQTAASETDAQASLRHILDQASGGVLSARQAAQQQEQDAIDAAAQQAREEAYTTWLSAQNSAAGYDAANAQDQSQQSLIDALGGGGTDVVPGVIPSLASQVDPSQLAQLLFGDPGVVDPNSPEVLAALAGLR